MKKGSKAIHLGGLVEVDQFGEVEALLIQDGGIKMVRRQGEFHGEASHDPISRDKARSICRRGREREPNRVVEVEVIRHNL